MMALGISHFAAKSHVDVKGVYSQFGNIVSYTTVRNLQHKAEESPSTTLSYSFHPFTLTLTLKRDKSHFYTCSTSSHSHSTCHTHIPSKKIY